MIIQILSNLCDEGYLEKDRYDFTSPFFAGANVAIRKEVFEQLDLYDEECVTGEDHDICLRAAGSDWDLYFQPKAIVRHNNKGTLRSFIRRWFFYGFKHPYVFKKHTPKALQVYITNRGTKKGALYTCILNTRRFPLHVVVFATSFLAMHIFLVLTLLAALLGVAVAAWILGAITALSGIAYIKSDIDIKHPIRSVAFACIRYIGNMTLLVGGLLGALRLRMIYISGTLDYKV